MELKLFPWDNDENPYWVNPENGLEWYVDKSTTEWCKKEHINGWGKLNAVVFYIAERKGDKVLPLQLVLIDAKTNDGFVLRFFPIAFTQRNKFQLKATTYAQRSQIKQIRRRMVEVITKEVSKSSLKDIVVK